MARLADTDRCIAPDSTGGFGLTDPCAPGPQGLISRTQHTADVIDALCLDKFTILGNSQGAFCAALYAMLHPERVDKVILVSSLTIANAIGISQPPNDAMKALGSYDGTREAMRRLLEALIVDRARITDALIDERQAAATRPENKKFVAAWHKAYGADSVPDFMAVQGYDGMAAIYPIIARDGAKISGTSAMKALEGWKFNSPRGPIMIDPHTRDIVQNMHVEEVMAEGDRLHVKVLETIPDVTDPCKALKFERCAK